MKILLFPLWKNKKEKKNRVKKDNSHALKLTSHYVFYSYAVEECDDDEEKLR